jgi:hypothetical protein
MNPNPFDEIPPWVTSEIEQFYAHALQMVDDFAAAVRRDIQLRKKQYGITDDSIHFALTMELIEAKQREPGGMMFFQAICAALLFRLANMPNTDDPLEKMMKGGRQ